MLRRVIAVGVLGGMAATQLLMTSSASASERVTCDPATGTCRIVVRDPGNAGSPGSTAPSTPTAGTPQATPACRVPVTLEPVDCFDDFFGWWSNDRGCYFRLVEPPPPPSASVWGGRYPRGAVYAAMCPGVAGTGGGLEWRPDPPAGFGGVSITPEQLAAQAVARLRLDGPSIRTAPPAGTGLVGLPMWMWTEVTPRTWGPQSATASIPGLSVTATARAVQMSWDMGNGSVVQCAGPGTPYTRNRGAAMSPDCGYRYEQPSWDRLDDVYQVTATTTWEITWVGGGRSGRLVETRSSSIAWPVGELQVLVS